MKTHLMSFVLAATFVATNAFAANQAEVETLYIAALNRYPTQEELANGIKTEKLVDVAVKITQKTEFFSVFPGYLTSDEFAEKLVSNVYAPTASADPSYRKAIEWSKAYIKQELAKGVSVGLLLAKTAESLANTTSPTYRALYEGVLATKKDVAEKAAANTSQTTTTSSATSTTAPAPDNTPPSADHIAAKKKLLDMVNDLLEQTDDQIKEDGKTPRTYPEGQSPAKIKEQLNAMKESLASAGYVSGLGGMETAVTGYGNIIASWNAGPGQGTGAAQSQIGTQQNAVTNAIQNQIGTPATSPAAAPTGTTGKFCYTVDGKQMCH